MVRYLVDDDITFTCGAACQQHPSLSMLTHSCCSHRPDQSPMRVSTPVELSRPSQPRAPSIPSTVEILLSPTPQSPGAAAVPWRHVAPPQAREPQSTQARVDLASPRPPPPAVMKKPTVAPVCLAQPATSTRFAAIYISMFGHAPPFPWSMETCCHLFPASYGRMLPCFFGNLGRLVATLSLQTM